MSRLSPNKQSWHVCKKPRSGKPHLSLQAWLSWAGGEASPLPSNSQSLLVYSLTAYTPRIDPHNVAIIQVRSHAFINISRSSQMPLVTTQQGKHEYLASSSSISTIGLMIPAPRILHMDESPSVAKTESVFTLISRIWCAWGYFL